MTLDALRGRRVVVTGGGGFIGGHVMASLAECGANAVAVMQAGLKRRVSAADHSISADLEDPEEAVRAFDGADFVVHLAARAGGIAFQQSTDPGVFSVNRRLTDNVLTACATAGVRRVFLASSLVIYRSSNRELAEGDPKLSVEDRPSPYAWSKISDEVIASWHGDVETVVGRFGNVYGPGARFDGPDATVVHALIARSVGLRDGEELEIWGDGTAVRSFIFVRDAANAALTILAGAAPGSVCNVDSGRAVTIAELASTVCDVVNPSLRLRFDASRPSGSPFRVPSVAALATLGFQAATPLSEGVGITADWYRQQQGAPSAGATRS